MQTDPQHYVAALPRQSKSRATPDAGKSAVMLAESRVVHVIGLLRPLADDAQSSGLLGSGLFAQVPVRV